MSYSFENKNPLWHTHPGIVLKPGQIEVDEEIVQTYPDNDGGRWYYDKDGERVIVRESKGINRIEPNDYGR